MDRNNSDGISKLEKGLYLVTFNPSLSSEVAIKKSLYKFAANFAPLLNLTEMGHIEVRIEFKKNVSESEHQELLQEFLNEVIDQDLRELIREETETTRTLILAEAFSKTSLLNKEE